MEKVSERKVREALELTIDILIDNEGVEYILELLIGLGWTRDDLLAECFDIEDIDKAFDSFKIKFNKGV